MEQSNTINPVSEPPKGSHCACGTNGTNPVQGLEYSPGKGRKPKLTPARVRFLQKNQHGTSTANDPVWQARYKESNKKLGRSARTLYPKFTRYENQFSLDYTANYDGGWLANSHTCQLHMSRLHGWLDTHFAGILKYTARECSEFIKAMTKDKYRRVNMHLLLKRADGGANEFTRLGELNALIEVARRTKIKTNGHRHWGHSQQDSQYLTLADHGPGAYADGTFSEDEMVALQKELTRLRYDWVSWNINPSFYELWVGKSETEIRKVEAEWEKGIECVTEIARANKANLANT